MFGVLHIPGEKLSSACVWMWSKCTGPMEKDNKYFRDHFFDNTDVKNQEGQTKGDNITSGIWPLRGIAGLCIDIGTGNKIKETLILPTKGIPEWLIEMHWISIFNNVMHLKHNICEKVICFKEITSVNSCLWADIQSHISWGKFVGELEYESMHDRKKESSTIWSCISCIKPLPNPEWFCPSAFFDPDYEQTIVYICLKFVKYWNFCALNFHIISSYY